MKTIITLLLFIAISVSNAQVLGVFSAKEGYDKAIETAKGGIDNPQLINVLTFNGSFDIPGVGNALKGEFRFEGDDAGKSNIWLYSFASTNDPNSIYQVAAAKLAALNLIFALPTSVNFADYGVSFSNQHPIDIEKLVNSDEFAKKLVENIYHSTMQDLNEEDSCMAVIGVGAIEYFDFLCLVPEEVDWIRIVMKGDRNFCCKASYDNVSNLTCGDYTGIKEIVEETPIYVYPMPAYDIVKISNPNNLEINNITILDVDGKEVLNDNLKMDNINVSSLSSGNYFVCFKIGNKKIYRSIIVNKN